MVLFIEIVENGVQSHPLPVHRISRNLYRKSFTFKYRLFQPKKEGVITKNTFLQNKLFKYLKKLNSGAEQATYAIKCFP